MPGQHPNRYDPDFACGLRVERCVADKHRELSACPHAPQRNFEDVCRRLATADIVPAGDRVHEILDLRKLQIVPQLVLLAVGGDRDLLSPALQLLQERSRTRQCRNVRQILFPEVRALPLDNLMALVFRCAWQKPRQHLVGIHAGVAVNLGEAEIMAERLQRFTPAAQGRHHGVDQRTLDVEDEDFSIGPRLLCRAGPARGLRRCYLARDHEPLLLDRSIRGLMSQSAASTSNAISATAAPIAGCSSAFVTAT